MCTAGLSVMCPLSIGVRSPSHTATTPCASSWMRDADHHRDHDREEERRVRLQVLDEHAAADHTVGAKLRPPRRTRTIRADTHLWHQQKTSSSSAPAPPAGRPRSTRPAPTSARSSIEGALTEENRLRGTLPLGQLNLTTEVENFPGFPHPGISGPGADARACASRPSDYGTRIVTEDVVDDRPEAPPVRAEGFGRHDASRRTRSSSPPAPARTTSAWSRRTGSRTTASARAPCATARCRASATSRWSSSAAATARARRATTSRSSPATSTSSTAAARQDARQHDHGRAAAEQPEGQAALEHRRRRSARRRREAA